MSEVITSLNQQLSNWNVLYVKLHNYHWNVKGRDFFTLHAKFEELYNEASVNIDEIAERVLALGGVPVGKLADYLTYSSLKEAEGSEKSAAMVSQIIQDFKTIVSESQEIIEQAAEASDDTTIDLMTGVVVALEKHIWLFNAFLGE